MAALPCPAPSGAKEALGGVDHAQRLEFLKRAVATDVASSGTWRLTWGAVYGVGTLAQMIAVPALSTSDQVDFYVGAFSTLVGAGFTIVATPDVYEDGPRLLTRLSAVAEPGCEQLADVERVARDDAANERSAIAWYNHGLNVVFNAAVGLFLGLVYGHWVSGLVNFLVGAAIGEATIFTSPTKLADAYDRYLSGELSPPQRARLELRPSQFGAGLALAF